MDKSREQHSRELAEHFFRNEYGRLVSVITGYIGTGNVQTAEDIVQETLLKAVEYWQHKGIPENPQAWLYVAAKNLTLNILKRKELKNKYDHQIDLPKQERENFQISEELILDDQLKMVFVLCHPSISENSQIALVLKILCGFSISEIANAFFSTNATINQRLVRGRKQLRKANISFEIPQDVNSRLSTVLKTIYLLFNEGYSPSSKNQLIRYDLCLEAIRLTEIMVVNKGIEKKSDCYSLLALMLLNAARFEARSNNSNAIIEMDKQDRGVWNQELINRGIYYLNKATKEEAFSQYLIMATISANHCIAPSFDKTNWVEILFLYDSLIEMEDTPILRLNRCVAISKVHGNQKAISEMKDLATNSDLGELHLYHSTLAEFYRLENAIGKTIEHLKKAIIYSKNRRDINFLEKKLKQVVIS